MDEVNKHRELSEAEQDYRAELQRVIAAVTAEFLRDHQTEIVMKAKERLEITRAEAE